MATKELFEAALGITSPWFVQGVDFEAEKHLLTIAVDFSAGSRFAHPDVPGEHPVHDTRTKRLRHLNFFIAQTFNTQEISCEPKESKFRQSQEAQARSH